MTRTPSGFGSTQLPSLHYDSNRSSNTSSKKLISNYNSEELKNEILRLKAVISQIQTEHSIVLLKLRNKNNASHHHLHSPTAPPPITSSRVNHSHHKTNKNNQVVNASSSSRKHHVRRRLPVHPSEPPSEQCKWNVCGCRMHCPRSPNNEMTSNPEHIHGLYDKHKIWFPRFHKDPGELEVEIRKLKLKITELQHDKRQMNTKSIQLKERLKKESNDISRMLIESLSPSKNINNNNNNNRNIFDSGSSGLSSYASSIISASKREAIKRWDKNAGSSEDIQDERIVELVLKNKKLKAKLKIFKEQILLLSKDTAPMKPPASNDTGDTRESHIELRAIVATQRDTIEQLQKSHLNELNNLQQYQRTLRGKLSDATIKVETMESEVRILQEQLSSEKIQNTRLKVRYDGILEQLNLQRRIVHGKQVNERLRIDSLEAERNRQTKIYNEMKMEKLKKIECAVMIQKHVRCHFQRQIYTAIIAQRHSNATRIQAIIRGRCERKVFQKKHAAASTLQRRYRKRLQKKYKIKTYHAIKIQAVVRGRLERHHLDQKRSAAVVLQQYYRHRLTNLHDKKDTSVLKIQSLFKGYKIRQDIKQMNQAALRIQSKLRSNLRRQDYLIQKQSVVKLQSLYRGHLSRKILSKHQKAATTIQSVYKRWIFTRQNKAALVIQVFFRAKKENLYILKKKHYSATKIQSVYRGIITRKAYLKGLCAGDINKIQAVEQLDKLAAKLVREGSLETDEVLKTEKLSEEDTMDVITKKLNTLEKRLILEGSFDSNGVPGDRESTGEDVLEKKDDIHNNNNEDQTVGSSIQNATKHYSNNSNIDNIDNDDSDDETKVINQLATNAEMKLNALKWRLVKEGSIEADSELPVSDKAGVDWSSGHTDTLNEDSLSRRLKFMKFYQMHAERTVRSTSSAILIQRRWRNYNKSSNNNNNNSRINDNDSYYNKSNKSIVTTTAVKESNIRSDSQIKMDNAAVKIQSHWRGFSTREMLLDMEVAALSIQSVYRMYKSQKVFLTVLQQRQYEVDEKKGVAATKIQAVFRGFQVREDLLDQEEAAISIQAAWRGKLQRDRFQAVVKIQTPSANVNKDGKDSTSKLSVTHNSSSSSTKMVNSRPKGKDCIGWKVELAFDGDGGDEWVDGVITDWKDNTDEVTILLDEEDEDDIEIIPRLDDDLVFISPPKH